MTGKQYAVDVRFSAHGNSMHLTRHDKNKWEIDTLSKRVISWISSAKLTYEDSDDNYKHRFNSMIQKQM